MKALIAAGGTAGHVVPALAVADALRADGHEVVFAGGQRAEAELVPAAGYELRPLNVEGISRSNPLKALRAIVKAAGALVAARRLLRAERPDVVMGGGGYVAGPVGAAAVLARIPLVLTEADSHLGLTNRALARFARRVCLAFPIDGRDRRPLPGDGPPGPAAGHRPRARRAQRFGLAEDETLRARLRRLARGALDQRGRDRRIRRSDVPRAPRLRRARLSVAARPGARSPNYDLREYITPFGDALAASDLCVARAGGSIFEIAAHGRPAILIPYPHAAGDHQTANAEWMRRAGAAVVLPTRS